MRPSYNVKEGSQTGKNRSEWRILVEKFFNECWETCKQLLVQPVTNSVKDLIELKTPWRYKCREQLIQLHERVIPEIQLAVNPLKGITKMC